MGNKQKGFTIIEVDFVCGYFWFADLYVDGRRKYVN